MSAAAPLPRPELLAPAGDWDCAKAAVENGADAIYFGLDAGFNARARATNFALEDLGPLMEFLRRRGVRGHLTLNTLAFCDELERLQPLIRAAAIAGVDAILVQDLGLARLIRALSPDQTIHASTQMTLTSAECIAAVADLGIGRVVLPRELDLSEIRRIRGKSEMPLEAFVHGALCVAYSGQCLTSESLGGRSANRGQCAQACRLPYELVCDGQDVDLGPVKYLLSPQDLAAYALTPELVAAGICSFKIEGRLKTAEYVANITRHYRAAIDAVWSGEPVAVTAGDVREMELSFSRGFSPGWLEGCDHKRLVPGVSSAKRGVFLGEVVDVIGQCVRVRLSGPVRRGDGIVFEGDRIAGDEQGGRIYGVWRDGQRLESVISTGIVELEFARGSLDLSRLEPGQAVWQTDDPELTARLRKTYTSADPLRKMPVDFHVRAVVGEPLLIRVVTESGATASATSEAPLQLAAKHPATPQLFHDQLDRLGHTAYSRRDVHCEFEGGPLVPLSVLSRVRRELIERLDRTLGTPPTRRLAQTDVLAELRRSIPDVVADRHARQSEAPRLHVLCRTLDQLHCVVDQPVDGIIADFQDPRDYREAVATARSAGRRLLLAPPRIQKPDEFGLFLMLDKCDPDGVLARNLSGLKHFVEQGRTVVADYSLNVTNDLTAQYLIGHGAHRLTASYDLNRDQLLTLAAAIPPSWLEVVLHQHMPMFHMEHCVFCAVLSPGTNKTNCGRPCDHHLVQLRDRVGMEHPLKADIGCRNTLYNATPQSAAEVVPELLALGLRDFRIELLDDAPAHIPAMLSLYRDLLMGRVHGDEVLRTLKAANRVGVTRGTLEERRNPLAIL